jgi:hypothetical protein
MLYSEIIAVCSQIHTKHINTLCGLNVDLYVKTVGKYNCHCVVCFSPAWGDQKSGDKEWQ